MPCPRHPGAAYDRTIHTWHVAISGFLQSEARPNGMQTLWRDLRASHCNGAVCVEVRDWSDSWSRLAEFIWRFRPADGSRPRIYVYAYSWGAGYGFLQLAHELRKRELSIETAVLSDPVYRSPWLAFRWLALCPWLRVIRVPDNVRTVHWFYQRMNLPRAHQVVAEDPRRTKVHPGIEVRAVHQYMDDSPEFRQTAVAVANAAHAAGMPGHKGPDCCHGTEGPLE